MRAWPEHSRNSRICLTSKTTCLSFTKARLSLPLFTLSLLHWHTPYLITPRGKGFKIQQGMILAPAGPRHPGHLDTWSILLGVGESTVSRGQVHHRPSALLSPVRTWMGKGLWPPQPGFRVKKIRGLRKHQRQILSFNSIRQLFQNILDLVFIVEHTYQGKVLHTQLQIIFGKKAVRKINLQLL